MSLFCLYISPQKVVAASDALVLGSRDVFPKFQVARTVSGLPLLLGASGLRTVAEHTFKILPKMLAETGMELPDLQKFLPDCFSRILSQRPASMVDRRRDVERPPIQTILAGFDADAGRLRVWIMLANGIGSGIVHELAAHDFAAIGFLEASDDARMVRFNRTIKANAPAHDAEWAAREMASEMKAIASAHRGEIGPPRFFAALDERGQLIELPPDLPLPPSVATHSESVARSAAAVQ